MLCFACLGRRLRRFRIDRSLSATGRARRRHRSRLTRRVLVVLGRLGRLLVANPVLASPAIGRGRLIVRLRGFRVALIGDRLKVFIVVFREKGDVAHLERAVFLVPFLLAFDQRGMGRCQIVHLRRQSLRAAVHWAQNVHGVVLF